MKKIVLGIVIQVLFHSFAFSQINISKIQNLALEGGGIKGVAYGGALKELEKNGILSQIVRVAGTSAGAIQATLLAVGYSADEIAQIVANTSVEKFNDNGFPTKAFARLKHEYGWFEGKVFQEQFRNLIQKRTGNADLTFAELHQMAKTYPFRDLYVTGCDLTAQRVVVFSYENYPNMKIADAVRVSMSIPLYYRAIWLNKKGQIIDSKHKTPDCHLFVDGGMLMNYPVEVFDFARYTSNFDGIDKPIFNEQTLGLRFDRCEQIDHEIENGGSIAPFEINDLNTYFSSLGNMMLRNANPAHPRDNERTIYINDAGMGSRLRKLAADEKIRMMETGKLGVIEFFNRTP